MTTVFLPKGSRMSKAETQNDRTKYQPSPWNRFGGSWMSVGKIPNEFCACCTLRYECNFHAGMSGIFRTSEIFSNYSEVRINFSSPPSSHSDKKWVAQSKLAAQQGSTPGPAETRQATSPPTALPSRQQKKRLSAPVSSAETRYRRLCKQVRACCNQIARLGDVFICEVPLWTQKGMVKKLILPWLNSALCVCVNTAVWDHTEHE